MTADVLKPADEEVGGLGGVGAVEEYTARLMPLSALAQHLPYGGEHGGGHGNDGLLGVAARTDANERETVCDPVPQGRPFPNAG